MRTEMDYLVMGNYLFAKEEQPALADDINWRAKFTLD
jgi:carbamoyltransferase